MREIADVPVSELMTSPVVTVTPETSVEALAEVMARHPFNAFPVVTATGALAGLVTRHDLFKLYLLPYRRFIPVLEDTWVNSVAAIMSRGVVTVFPVEPAIKAIALMVDHGIRTIPVVTDTTAGRVVVGVVTRRDLTGALKP
jgi:CBS domain-containing protein